MNQKIFIANILLLIVIVILGYLVATTQYVPPSRSASASLKATESKGGEGDEPAQAPEGSETGYVPPAPTKNIAMLSDRYPNFGKSPVFDTIIPKPTPRPTPTPKPKLPPDINRVTARWKLSSILDNMAMFHDSGTKKEWNMNVGETYDIKYRNESCSIKLEKVDMNKFEVVISFGEQQRTLSMW